MTTATQTPTTAYDAYMLGNFARQVSKDMHVSERLVLEDGGYILRKAIVLDVSDMPGEPGVKRCTLDNGSEYAHRPFLTAQRTNDLGWRAKAETIGAMQGASIISAVLRPADHDHADELLRSQIGLRLRQIGAVEIFEGLTVEQVAALSDFLETHGLTTIVAGAHRPNVVDVI